MSSPDARENKRARTRAVLAMCGASFLFSLMAVTTKLASQRVSGGPELPASEVALVRYCSGILCLLVLARITSTNLWGGNKGLLIGRGLSGGIASTLFFISIHATSVTHATLLNSTNVMFGSVFAALLLGEKLRTVAGVAILTALVGVVLVTNTTVGHIRAGDAIALLSGVIAGLSIVQVRSLRQTESSMAVFFYFNLIGIPVSLLSLIPMHTHLIAPDAMQWRILVGVGLSSVGGQLLMTYGYKALPAAQGSLLILTSVVLTALLSHLIFRDPFSIFTVIGGVLILFSAIALCTSPRRSAVLSSSGDSKDADAG